MKLDKLIYNLKNLKNGGEHTDDTLPGNRQFEFIIDHFRSEIAAQRVNQKKSVIGFLQSADELKLKSYKGFRHPDVTFLTTENLPSIVTSHRGHIIERVGTRNRPLGMQKSSLSTYALDLSNPLTREVYFIEGDNLVIATKNNSMLREVFVSAVFESPREVLIANGKADETTGHDWEYPLPGNLVGSVNNMVINNEFRWASMLKADLINDGKDAE